MEVLLTTDLSELDGRLRHTLRRVAIATHDALRQRAVIGADAHSGVMRLTNLYQRGHPLPYPLQLVLILLLGELQLASIAVGVVAGVNAHLLHQRGGHLGGLGVEVDVGHQWHLAAALQQLLLDAAEVLGSLHIRRGDTHQLAAHLHHTEGLLHSGLRVHRVGVRHALHPYRRTTAQREVSYLDFSAHNETVLTINNITAIKKVPVQRLV